MSVNKKILITGASGFVGSFLVEEALNLGYDVYAGMRKSSSTEFLKDTRINFINLDLSLEASIEKAFQNIYFDKIIHCAGITKAKEEESYYQINAYSLEKLLEVITRNNLIPKKFIFISSLAAYGPADLQPTRIVSNKSQPKPVTTYGKSKLKGERILTKYKNIPWHIIRPTAVYGPREADLLTVYKMINRRLELLIGNDPQQLTFVYVKDLVNAIMGVLEIDNHHTSYFVTDGQLYSTEEFNKEVKNQLGKTTLKMKLPITLIKILAIISEKISSLSGNYPALNLEKVNELKCQSWHCDITDLIKDTGYQPKYSLERGMHETIKWYKKKHIL